MLVNNPCVNDSRVIREAEALAGAGYEVVVVARSGPGLPVEQCVRDVRYIRVPGLTEPGQDRRTAIRRWSHSLRYRVAGGASSLCAWVGVLIGALAMPVAAALWPLLMARQMRAGQLRSPAGHGPAVPAEGAPRPSRRQMLKAWLSRQILTFLLFEDVEVAMAQAALALQPSILHAHDLGTLPTAGEVARRLGARLVYDSHELELHRNARYSMVGQWWRAWLERHYIARTAAVITVSDGIADHLAAQYSIARPLVVLNSPAYEAISQRSTQSVRGVVGLPAEIPLAIYVGRVTTGRGIEQCIRMLRHYPQLHFAVVGPRAPVAVQFAMLAAAEGVAQRYHVVDPVPSAQVVSFVRDADVSVVAIQNVCLSYYYCMPNKLLESVMGGLPVVVSNLPELRRFVESNRCGEVMDESSPSAIAAAVRKVIENRAAYQLDPVPLQNVRRQYGWDAQACVLLDGYRSLR